MKQHHLCSYLIRIKVRTLNEAYQQIIFLKDDKTRKEHSKIFEKIDNKPILKMKHDRIKITYIIQKNLSIIFPTRKEWESECNSLENEDLVLYSDGSKIGTQQVSIYLK